MHIFERTKGVFTPHEIREMRETLKLESPPSETAPEREMRAVEIVQRKLMEQD